MGKTLLRLFAATLVVAGLGRGFASADERVSVDFDNGRAKIKISDGRRDDRGRQNRDIGRQRDEERRRAIERERQLEQERQRLRERERQDRERQDRERHERERRESAYIMSGDRVIDSFGNVGTVTMVFSNGQAKVKFDNSNWYEQDKAVSELSKSVQCVGSFCQESQVLDRFNSVGTIKLVFMNGKAKVRMDNSNWTDSDRTLSELAASIRCADRVCVGDRVMDSWHSLGTIRLIFSNGQAKVRMDNSNWTDSDKNVRELARLMP